MVNSCCVTGCKNESYPGSRFSFHGFPKNENKKLKWENAVPGKNLKSSVVCSAHFKCDDFIAGYTRKMLKPDAVPSIFPKILGRSSCEEIQNELDTEMMFQNSTETYTYAEPTSDASEEEALNSDSETVHTKVILSNKYSSEEELSNPGVETINSLALKVTLARIAANPQLYIGIPKNCYHLIDIIHKHTDIPTTHILLCLKKIKLDTHFEELADQFGITADEASQIFTSNVPALANVLHSFVNNQNLEIPLRSENSSCVIDSLEIKVQPSSDNSSDLTQTKQGNTVKYVVCCTPDGYINYVSPGYGGRQSDERLLEDTKYLDRLNSGDSVVTNGLWNVESMLLQKGLKVVKPRARQKDCAKFCATQDSTTNETQPSEDQVKRLVQRIREFTMVKDHSGLSCELVRVLDEAVVISCALINLQSFVIN